MADFITLSNTSRYKDTKVFDGDRGSEFGLWEAPVEFTQQDDGYVLHRIAGHEVGFLDILAVQYYGEGYEILWWSIALANGIIDPEQELEPNDVIQIPPRSAALQFLSRRGNG